MKLWQPWAKLHVGTIRVFTKDDDGKSSSAEDSGGGGNACIQVMISCHLPETRIFTKVNLSNQTPNSKQKLTSIKYFNSHLPPSPSVDKSWYSTSRRINLYQSRMPRHATPLVISSIQIEIDVHCLPFVSFNCPPNLNYESNDSWMANSIVCPFIILV